jgi:RimJ/RimL family protein N-acetyltransferase
MSNEVRLRNVEPNDLPIFYEQQLDADATRMAAFPSRDRAAFDAHWATKILGNPQAVTQTILVNDQVAGNIGSWPQDGGRLVGYWIGKEYWARVSQLGRSPLSCASLPSVPSTRTWPSTTSARFAS